MRKNIKMSLEEWNLDHLDRIAILELQEIMFAMSLYLDMVHERAGQIEDTLFSCGKSITEQMHRIVRSQEVIHQASCQKLNLQKSEFDLMELLTQESDKWCHQIKKESISFSLAGDHIWVSGDEPLLRLMVENMLCHVLYNSPRNGAVKVHITKTDRVLLQIIDKECEISERNQTLLMGRRTLHEGPEYIGAATGIALAAVGIIARAHGVRVETRRMNPQNKGRGTCYLFAFPESD